MRSLLYKLARSQVLPLFSNLQVQLLHAGAGTHDLSALMQNVASLLASHKWQQPNLAPVRVSQKSLPRFWLSLRDLSTTNGKPTMTMGLTFEEETQRKLHSFDLVVYISLRHRA